MNFRDWFVENAQSNFLPVTPQNIALAKNFILRKWKERAIERGVEEPQDLTNACKFASLFTQSLFGGQIRGNWHHQFLQVNGQIVDLTDAIGVKMEDPYKHDKKFWHNRERELPTPQGGGLPTQLTA